MIWIKQWLLLLGRASWQAGVIVLILLTTQFLFRKHLPPRWRSALWFLVALRLILPVSISSAWSIFNWVPAFTTSAFAPPQISTKANQIPDDAPATTIEQNVVSGNAPSPAPQQLQPFPKAEIFEPSTAMNTPVPAPPTASIPASNSPFPWTITLFLAWLAGTLLLLAHTLFTSIRFSRKSAKLQPVTDDNVLQVFAEARKLIRLRARIDLAQNPFLSSPAVHGVFRPQVMMPPALLERLSPNQLRFVFLHELAHVKHRDIFTNWVATLLQIIHWFNPLIWIGFARWRADRELTADAAALEAAGMQSNQDYGRTILQLLEQSQPVALPSVAGIMEDRRRLRERISMIASFAPRGRWSFPGIGLAILLGAVALSDGQTQTDQPGPVTTEMLSFGKEARHSLTNGRALTIVVLSEESGRPIQGATVTGASFIKNVPETTPPAKTDGSGRAVIRLGESASIKRIQAQHVSVAVHAPGYAGKGIRWLSRGEDARSGLPAELSIKLPRGERVGGVVRDAQGKPLPGVQLSANGSTYEWGGAAPYSQISVGDDASSPVTDAEGRWEIPDFPKDLHRLNLSFRRADGSITRFSNEQRPGFFQRMQKSFEMAKLRNRTEAFVLEEGFTVRGVVVDLSGSPVPNVLIKEGYGMNRPEVVNQFRTDSKGRFELRNRAAQEMILTAEPENHSIGSTVVRVGPDTPRARITVFPLSPLTVRVMDQDKKPVAGAKVSPGYPGNASDGVWPRLEGMVLDFETTTDENGVAIWKNAPVANLVLTAHSSALNTWRTIPIDATATREVLIQLRPGAEKEFFIQVKATEEGTAKPVIIDRVYLVPGSHENDELFSSPKKSDFTLPFPIDAHWKGPGFGGCRLRFEATGYAPVVMPEKGSRDFNAGDWVLDLKMRPSATPSGWVLLEGGAPAVGAVVVAALNNASFPHLQDDGKLYHDERHQRATTDSIGFFELKDTGVDRVVLISHEKGFLETRTGILRSQPRLTLQPWGKLEGKLRLGDKPEAQTRLHLRGGPPQERHEDLWMAGLTSVTDSDGKFTFDKVPPGQLWLSRYYKAQTYQVAVAVRPGQTTRIEDGGKGRTVTAKVPPVHDWTRDPQLLVTPRETRSFPHWDDFASRAAMDKAMEEYRRRESGNQYDQAYPALIEKDGTLRVHDVPPGKYELRLKVTAPPESDLERMRPFAAKVLASITREVIVPAENADEILDLGELEIDSGRAAEEGAAIDFTAMSPDGKKHSLKDYRGKPLLVVFWAGWSKKSAEELNAIKELARTVGNGLAILGVNVADAPPTVKSEAATRGYTWDQVALTGPDRTKVSALFGVETLPSVALVNRNGQLDGRNLQGEALRAAVQRALK